MYFCLSSYRRRNLWFTINWILTVCEEKNTPKLYRYHPGLWLGKKWSCCKSAKRIAFGCQAATHWSETNNNPSKLNLFSYFILFFWFVIRRRRKISENRNILTETVCKNETETEIHNFNTLFVHWFGVDIVNLLLHPFIAVSYLTATW